MRAAEIASIILALLLIVLGVIMYPRMPAMMASHWDASGNVNGYSSRFTGVFLMPIILSALVLLFMAIPRIDPLKQNIEKFRNYYDGFIILISILMFSLEIFILRWNLGFHMSTNVVMPIGIGILFFYAGILSENAKRNWFIGFRTPWTLSSEEVWNKTHRLGGTLFKAAGVISIAGAFFADYAFYFILIPALTVAIFSFIYSYVIYQRLQKEGKSGQ